MLPSLVGETRRAAMLAYHHFTRTILAEFKLVTVVILVIVLSIWWTANSYQKSGRYLRRYPWVGVSKTQWFGQLRGAVRSFRCAAEFGLEGYSKVRLVRPSLHERLIDG